MFSILSWVVFFLIITVLMALDLGVISKSKKSLGFKTALLMMCMWFVIAMVFAVVIFYQFDSEHAVLFVTGYLVELALSIDNIFIFILIFNYFKIEPKNQHRVLVIGIISAIVMRFLMISSGIYLINKFQWIFYIFGVFLIYSAYKIVFSNNEDSDISHDNKFISFLKKYLNFTDEIHGEKFIIKKGGKVYFTPLFLVLIFIEKADLIFALDSIPAILAITDNLFIVFTSNIFAILGLRSMYHVLANIIHRFIYIKHALAFILGYIGVKMIASVQGFHIPIALSLSLIVASILIAIGVSLISSKKQANK